MGTKRGGPGPSAHGVGAVVVAVLGVGACNSPHGAPPNFGSSGSDDGVGTSAADTTATEATGDTTAGVDQGWEVSLEVGQEVGAFYAVWGPAPDLLYAVAGQPLEGGLSQGTLYRYDGAAWSPEVVPADTAALHWVFGVGTQRVIVGDLGTILLRDGDAGDWVAHSCGTILPLWGVWGAAADDLWAVGGDGFNRDPIACHYDGAAWTLTELTPSFDSFALYKVWGTASDDVWAVGDEGLLVHWQGEADGWQEVPSDTDVDLISLWGTGPQEILAVGGRTSGVLSRYDGTQWTSSMVPLQGLNGTWMDDDGTSTIVGPLAGMAVVAPGSLEAELDDAGTPLALHGVFGFPGVERWAVGGSLDMAPPHVGVILRRAP